MHITDPDTAPTDDTAPDPASVAETPEVPTPEPEVDEGAAMLAAIEAEEAPKEAAPAEEVKPDKPDAAAKDAKPDAPEPDAEVEAEITGLQLKEKAAARFRELTTAAKEVGPLREALEQAGIKDVSELPQLVTRAKDGQDLMAMVQATGATPDQFGMTLDYTSAINAAMGGDVEAGERAWAMFMDEGKSLAKTLGKEFQGLHDPLAEHADLQADVENGDISRARALELATTRQREAVRTQADSARKQQSEQSQQQTQQTAAETQGRSDLNTLGEELGAADPHFQAKLPQLLAFRDLVRKAHPPAQWAGELRKLYATIPSPAPAPAKLPTPGPVRANGPMPTMAPTFDDPMEAMMAGINAAT